MSDLQKEFDRRLAVANSRRDQMWAMLDARIDRFEQIIQATDSPTFDWGSLSGSQADQRLIQAGLEALLGELYFRRAKVADAMITGDPSRGPT